MQEEDDMVFTLEVDSLDSEEKLRVNEELMAKLDSLMEVFFQFLKSELAVSNPRARNIWTVLMKVFSSDILITFR